MNNNTRAFCTAQTCAVRTARKLALIIKCLCLDLRIYISYVQA